MLSQREKERQSLNTSTHHSTPWLWEYRDLTLLLP